MEIIKMLSGKKTLIGGLLLSLSGLVFFLDTIFHSAGSPHWFTQEQYNALALFIGGLTGVTMRMGSTADKEAIIKSVVKETDLVSADVVDTGKEVKAVVLAMPQDNPPPQSRTSGGQFK